MLQGKEKKEKYREATRLQLPTELLAPCLWCTSTKRCPSITDDAEDIRNDAQSIKCDEKTSIRCTKHPMRCTSIHTMPQASSNISEWKWPK